MKTPNSLKVAAPIAPVPEQAEPRPVARDRSKKVRHVLIAVSFVLMVILPISASTVYLYGWASNQFHSFSAFAVRSEEFQNPLEVLGAFTQAGGSSAPDSEIIYDFIRSQTLVQKIDAELDLNTIFNRPADDPLLTLGQGRSIEDMLDYWDRMVSVAIDSGTGVLELKVRAFSPQDARQIAEKIIENSSVLVEDLSRVAREDAMRYTLRDVAEAEDRLKQKRREIREFRTLHQIINPEVDMESQIGVVAALQTQLAQSLVDMEAMRSYSDENDPRLENIRRRIDAIRSQIANERENISVPAANGQSFSEIIGGYEELLVDLEFSQQAYTAALVAQDQARAEARRQSRYLAVHIPPTLAQDSLYPDRPILILIISACAFAAWAVLVMIYYNVRDRR